MSAGPALFVSLLLLAGNAFFVAAEFALVASRRHRLEELAARGGAGARAAARASRELSLMLAGAQLGVTLCSLGIGALAEPALAHLLDPAFGAFGLPTPVGDAVAFLLALAVVVFAHMVVGEMAPKSVAIAHPERAATLLAPLFRAFTGLARPVLAVLNALVNAVLRVVGVRPRDTVARAHGPDELRVLLRQSVARGLLAEQQQEMLTRVLQLRRTTVGQVMRPATAMVTVAGDTAAPDVEEASRRSGRSRLVVLDARGEPAGIVHVRDVVRATTAGRHATARELMTPAFALRPEQAVVEAVAAMRRDRAQLALVADARGRVVGLAALEDLLEEILGEFSDETDRLPDGVPA